MHLRNYVWTLLLVLATSLSAVYHSGTISSDETWLAADNPHEINGDLTVANGATLTIEAGCNCYMAYGADFTVQGVLDCNGIASQPVLITSDQHHLNPDPGDWGRLTFSYPDDECVLNYTSILYGGAGDGDMVRLVGCNNNVRFNFCSIAYSDDVGIYCYSAGDDPTLTATQVNSNTGYPLYCGAPTGSATWPDFAGVGYEIGGWTLVADNLTATTWSEPAPAVKQYYRVTADN